MQIDGHNKILIFIPWTMDGWWYFGIQTWGAIPYALARYSTDSRSRAAASCSSLLSSQARPTCIIKRMLRNKQQSLNILKCRPVSFALKVATNGRPFANCDLKNPLGDHVLYTAPQIVFYFYPPKREGNFDIDRYEHCCSVATASSFPLSTSPRSLKYETLSVSPENGLLSSVQTHWISSFLYRFINQIQKMRPILFSSFFKWRKYHALYPLNENSIER